MAEKILNTRIKLKIDTLANWNAVKDTFKPLAGEVCIAEVPTVEGTTLQPVMMKIGQYTDSTKTNLKTWGELDWISAKAADVYGWAKAATKPTYTASEITGLEEFIAGKIQDTNDNTTYAFEIVDGKLQVTETPHVLGVAGTPVVTSYDFVTPDELTTILEDYYTTNEIDTMVNGKLHTEAEIKTIAATEINRLIGAADDEGGETIQSIANLVDYVEKNAGEIAGLVTDVATANTNASNAVSTANAANTTANSALTKAESALEGAAGAAASAAAAAQSATDAAGSAATATEKASDAADSASAASNSATTASEKATAAANSASAAADSASTASTKAGEAATSAQTAATNAQTATEKASAATQSATDAANAKAAAVTAQGAAESAKAAAVTAQGKAEDAQGAAETAQAKAEAAQEAAEASNTSATAIANAAKTASETATSAVNDIKANYIRVGADNKMYLGMEGTDVIIFDCGGAE